MQMGSNTDVPRLGLTVHVQTEDHGLGTRKMTTQVFFSGAIIDSRTISYADDVAGIEAPAERDEKVRKLMKAMHKHFITRVTSGQYDERLPLQKNISVDIPVDDLVSAAATETPHTPPPVVPNGKQRAWRGVPPLADSIEHDLAEAISDAIRAR